jgi:hypothetical protein
MKYLIRGIYAFAIGMNVGILGLMLFTDFKLSFWNQVTGQVVLIGVFIYWLMQFEKYEKRREEINRQLSTLLDELSKDLSDYLENLHRLSRDKRINRVLSEDSIQDEEGQENKKSTAHKRVQIMRDSEDKKVATKQQRKSRSVHKGLPPKE